MARQLSQSPPVGPRANIDLWYRVLFANTEAAATSPSLPSSDCDYLGRHTLTLTSPPILESGRQVGMEAHTEFPTPHRERSQRNFRTSSIVECSPGTIGEEPGLLGIHVVFTPLCRLGDGKHQATFPPHHITRNNSADKWSLFSSSQARGGSNPLRTEPATFVKWGEKFALAVL